MVNLGLEALFDRMREGLIAGIIGIAVGYVTDASTKVLSTIGIPWYLWIIWLMILAVDFIMGIAEVENGGISFAIGITLAGALLANPWTVLTGFLGILGLIIGVAIKWRN